MQLSMSGIHPDFAHENKPPKRAVSVSRKDTIIIAMLVNIALLAVLFATASRQSSPEPKLETVVTKVETVVQPVPQATKVVSEPVDEIDEILKTYAQTTPKPAPAPVATPIPTPAPVAAAPKPEPVVTKTVPYKEVTVKKGDVLSRIAKQHGVDMKDIILLNHLENAKLKIGQVLKIPIANAKTPAVTNSTNRPDSYVVQEGDSPWKIARKCGLSVEELLKLNNLDEEKARNLKIGQTLRTR